MKSRSRTSPVFTRACAAIFLLCAASASQAVLIKSYDFDSDTSDTLGNGADLIASGGVISGGRYSFAPNQGLQLNNPVADSSVFAVEMKLQSNDGWSGYNKLIDFNGLGSDSGLYVFSEVLRHYTLTGQVGPVLPVNQDIVIGLERNGGTMNLYVDGTQVSSSSSSQIPASILRMDFFEDDFATGQGEAFRGSVDWIRIHDDASTFGTSPSANPVAEPTTLVVLGFGLVGLGLGRRRKA